MSYILDALKKSEQERHPDKVPDLTTQHSHVVPRPEKKFPWGWVISITVLVNIAVIYYFVSGANSTTVTPANQISVQDDSKQEAVEEQPKMDTSERVAIKTAVIESEPVSSEPVVDETDAVIDYQAMVEVQPSATSEVTPIQNKQANKSFADLPHISELSQSIQDQIPKLDFSTHIFVKDGGSFVIINGANLSEGMRLSSGLVLEKVVREGVIFSYRDRFFTLNSMESWYYLPVGHPSG